MPHCFYCLLIFSIAFAISSPVTASDFGGNDIPARGQHEPAGQLRSDRMASTAAPDNTSVSGHYLAKTAAKIWKIMPLGDSITSGFGPADTGKDSYRWELSNKLKAAGIEFDFVGSMNKPYCNQDGPHMDYDLDHEGHYGWNTNNILNGDRRSPACKGTGTIRDWLEGYTPDISLIHLGTNDMINGGSESAVCADINTIISIIRDKNPFVIILLAKIIPFKDKPNPEKAAALNVKIDSLAAAITLANSPVVVVDQYTGFDPAVDLADYAHPNTTGEEKMAAKWFDAIATAITIGLPSFIPTGTVTVSPESAVIYRNETITVTAALSPADATTKRVIWSSVNTGVAVVDSTGKVTGMWAGETFVVAKTYDGGFMDSCSITVLDTSTANAVGNGKFAHGNPAAQLYQPNDNSVHYFDMMGRGISIALRRNIRSTCIHGIRVRSSNRTFGKTFVVE
jgi:acyl-CoA thioesterase-1